MPATAAEQAAEDMAFLVERAEFRRFLFRSIQTAGILSDSDHGATGADGRDLAFHEGRRSLCFDLLRDAESALPAAARHPLNIMTLMAVLREGADCPRPERRNDRDERDSD